MITALAVTTILLLMILGAVLRAAGAGPDWALLAFTLAFVALFMGFALGRFST